MNYNINPVTLHRIVDSIDGAILKPPVMKEQVVMDVNDASLLLLAAKDWLRLQQVGVTPKPVPAMPIDTVIAASAAVAGVDRGSMTITYNKASNLWKATVGTDSEEHHTAEQAIQALGRKLVDQLKQKRDGIDRVIARAEG